MAEFNQNNSGNIAGKPKSPITVVVDRIINEVTLRFAGGVTVPLPAILGTVGIDPAANTVNVTNAFATQATLASCLTTLGNIYTRAGLLATQVTLTSVAIVLDSMKTDMHTLLSGLGTQATLSGMFSGQQLLATQATMSQLLSAVGGGLATQGTLSQVLSAVNKANDNCSFLITRAGGLITQIAKTSLAGTTLTLSIGRVGGLISDVSKWV